jgi:hypothetical protein
VCELGEAAPSAGIRLSKSIFSEHQEDGSMEKRIRLSRFGVKTKYLSTQRISAREGERKGTVNLLPGSTRKTVEGINRSAVKPGCCLHRGLQAYPRSRRSEAAFWRKHVRPPERAALSVASGDHPSANLLLSRTNGQTR